MDLLKFIMIPGYHIINSDKHLLLENDFKTKIKSTYFRVDEPTERFIKNSKKKLPVIVAIFLFDHYSCNLFKFSSFLDGVCRHIFTK